MNEKICRDDENSKWSDWFLILDWRVTKAHWKNSNVKKRWHWQWKRWKAALICWMIWIEIWKKPPKSWLESTKMSNCLNGRSHLHLTCPSYSKISDLSITYGTLLSNSIRAMTFGSEVNRSILYFHELPINTDCYCLFDICRSFPRFGFTCNRPWYQCNAQASHRAGHNIPKLCGT